MPFLREHYPNDNYVFWPDCATAHYAKYTIKIYNNYNINFLKRDQNPPNVPQLRKIETFWAHRKAKVYENDWQSKNLTHLISRIRLKLKEFSPDYFQRLMSKCKTKIRKAADMGPEYMFT